MTTKRQDDDTRKPNLLFVPLPFVNALLLALLFAFLLRGNGTHGTRAFLILIALCCVQSVAIGLRWGYGITEVRFAQPMLAACAPPLTYEAFRGLVQTDRPNPYRIAAVPASILAVLLVLLLWPEGLDEALILLFLGYAVALLRLARSGPDGLDLARLDGAVSAHRAIYLAAACLCLSVVFDILILLDFEWSAGANAAALVSNANILSLLLIGFAALTAGSAQTGRGPDEGAQDARAEGSKETEATAADAEIAERIDALMIDRKLFSDENLNLARLARRAGLPARQVSRAINRISGKNVSRYVNDFRIAEACRLLEQEDTTVTEIMFRSGFVTKSNFNREFLRVTGQSPDAWRKANRKPL